MELKKQKSIRQLLKDILANQESILFLEGKIIDLLKSGEKEESQEDSTAWYIPGADWCIGTTWNGKRRSGVIYYHI